MKCRVMLIGAAMAFSSVVMVGSAAQAAVVNFDDAAGVAQAYQSVSPITDQGLVFSFSDGLGYIWGGGEDPTESNGTYNYIYAYGAGLTITKPGGGNFSLDTADLTLSWYTAADGGQFDPPTTLASDTITVTAQTAGGPVVETLTLIQGFQTYSLGLSDVSSVLITGNSSGIGYWGLDNLTGSGFGAAVPEPATWAMMLVGFGGLGAAMRSRRKQAAVTA